MYERNMVSTKSTKKKVSSSKPSSSASSCKYKKVGETKDSAHKCVYVKTGTATGSDKNSKYYTASIVDGKRKYKVYNGEVKRVQKGGWGLGLGGLMGCSGANCTNGGVDTLLHKKGNVEKANLQRRAAPPTTSNTQQSSKIGMFTYISNYIENKVNNNDDPHYELFWGLNQSWSQFLAFCTKFKYHHKYQDIYDIYDDFNKLVHNLDEIPLPNYRAPNNYPYKLFIMDIDYMDELVSKAKQPESSLQEITTKWRTDRINLLTSIKNNAQNKTQSQPNKNSTQQTKTQYQDTYTIVEGGSHVRKPYFSRNELNSMSIQKLKNDYKGIVSMGNVDDKMAKYGDLIDKVIDQKEKNKNSTPLHQKGNGEKVEYTVYIKNMKLMKELTTLPESIKKYDTMKSSFDDDEYQKKDWRYRRDNYEDFYIKYDWVVSDENNQVVEIPFMNNPLSLFEVVTKCEVYVKQGEQKLKLKRIGNKPQITLSDQQNLKKYSNDIDYAFDQSDWDKIKAVSTNFSNILNKYHYSVSSQLRNNNAANNNIAELSRS